MPIRPFRFVHATNLRLDQPLWGVGSITAAARRIAEDATLTALGHIVDACIGNDAACLLLTGNCFDSAHSYRARRALESACERLEQHHIEVFIVPGTTDPAAAWLKGVALPSNVTTFVSHHSEPVALVRDSEVLATVEPYENRQHQSDSGVGASALRIALVGAGQHTALQTALAAAGESVSELRLINEFPQAARFGYLALGNGSDRFTVELPRGLAHDPGCPQPLDGQQTEASGCSLIEVNRAGQLQVTRLSTAVVRREEISLSLSEGESWDQLAQHMQAALLERQPLPTEKLWLVRWSINGDQALADSLAEPSARQELCELVEEELADDRGLVREHEMEFRKSWSQWGDLELTGSVFDEFTTFVDEQSSEYVAQFAAKLPGIDWPEAGWVKHLVDAGERVRPTVVAAHAHNLAREHLLPLESLSSAR